MNIMGQRGRGSGARWALILECIPLPTLLKGNECGSSPSMFQKVVRGFGRMSDLPADPRVESKVERGLQLPFSGQDCSRRVWLSLSIRLRPGVSGSRARVLLPPAGTSLQRQRPYGESSCLGGTGAEKIGRSGSFVNPDGYVWMGSIRTALMLKSTLE